MPSLIPSFLFSTKALRQERCSCHDWGIYGENSRGVVSCDFLVTSNCTLTFNNCVSSIMLGMDQCSKTNGNFSVARQTLTLSWALGEAEMHYAANTPGLDLSLKKHFNLSWSFPLPQHSFSKKLCIIKRKNSSTGFWSRNYVLWTDAVDLTLYYKDTKSDHYMSELISSDEHFWRLNLAVMWTMVSEQQLKETVLSHVKGPDILGLEKSDKS